MATPTADAGAADHLYLRLRKGRHGLHGRADRVVARSTRLSRGVGSRELRGIGATAEMPANSLDAQYSQGIVRSALREQEAESCGRSQSIVRRVDLSVQIPCRARRPVLGLSTGYGRTEERRACSDAM